MLITNQDDYFDEILTGILTTDLKNILFMIDFDTEDSWIKCVEKFPSILHFGNRYVKTRNQFHSN